MEVFYGLGFILGPLIGGAIYSIGGYILPFMLLGGVLLLDSAFIFLVLPKVNWENTNAETQGNLWSILKVPSVVLDTFCTTAAAISMGFYSATLEPHLRQILSMQIPICDANNSEK
ncbi:unnamed protein product [Timema podura]|uniref:Major facilitator superfamily (MFS) profile domain-containing protein n=1 Tax=Timema podura TaxID=61482 RepID=A0ABN7NJS0_TIMPD|nr:unnamed protein product [Timema podura]